MPSTLPRLPSADFDLGSLSLFMASESLSINLYLHCTIQTEGVVKECQKAQEGVHIGFLDNRNSYLDRILSSY